MKAMIGGAFVALGLAGAATAQEQYASFARIGGRFVALQAAGRDTAASSSSFRFVPVHAEQPSEDDYPVVRRAAGAPTQARQIPAVAISSTAAQSAQAELKPTR